MFYHFFRSFKWIYDGNFFDVYIYFFLLYLICVNMYNVTNGNGYQLFTRNAPRDTLFLCEFVMFNDYSLWVWNAFFCKYNKKKYFYFSGKEWNHILSYSSQLLLEPFLSSWISLFFLPTELSDTQHTQE